MAYAETLPLPYTEVGKEDVKQSPLMFTSWSL